VDAAAMYAARLSSNMAAQSESSDEED
jgi:hypothetical protein